MNNYLIKPLDYPTTTVRLNMIGEKNIYHTTEGDQCWNTVFPCSPYMYQHLQLRGQSFQQGFRFKGEN